jgi:hypothetical protein
MPQPTLQKTIIKKFVAKLAAEKAIEAEKIAQLEKLLADGIKVKADDLVKIFLSEQDGVM